MKMGHLSWAFKHRSVQGREEGKEGSPGREEDMDNGIAANRMCGQRQGHAV